SHINHSFDELNRKLEIAVRERGVNFLISEIDRQAIRKAGGSEHLIAAINASPIPPESVSKRVDYENALYQVILSNYKSMEPERLQKAIDAAKEFLRRYGDDPGARPQVDWIRPKIPIWESRFPSGKY